MNEAVREVTRLYADTFSAQPAVVSRAPGRVEILGNHTDYNEGYVLSCAIDREIHAALGPCGDDGRFGFVSAHYPEPVAASAAEPQGLGNWVNYPLGVCAVLRERGLECPAFRMAVHSTIPLGAGLSSSAALEVSTGAALRSLFDLSVSDFDLAHVCQKAENTFTGAQCGLLDQFSSLFGRQDHFLFLDFRTLEHRAVRLPDPDLCLALALSGVTHSLAESAYNDRRAECTRAGEFFASRSPNAKTLRDITMAELRSAGGALDPVARRRAAHIVGEDERVLKGVRLLEEGALESFGKLLYESHRSSVENFENSCPELDALVGIAEGVHGVHGSRLTGGGFGGATLTLLPRGRLAAFEKAVKTGYHPPDSDTTVVYAAATADGAGVVQGE
jgi:galactokinase